MNRQRVGGTRTSHPPNSDFRFQISHFTFRKSKIWNLKSGGASGRHACIPPTKLRFRLPPHTHQIQISSAPHTHQTQISDFRFQIPDLEGPKSEIWNMNSVCGWVAGCCLKSQTLQIWNPKSEIWNLRFGVRMGGWLLLEEPDIADLKSEIWNLKSEFGGLWVGSARLTHVHTYAVLVLVFPTKTTTFLIMVFFL